METNFEKLWKLLSEKKIKEAVKYLDSLGYTRQERTRILRGKQGKQKVKNHDSI